MLTKFDKVEESLNKILSFENSEKKEKETKLLQIIDMKIENVVLKLGVPRESVHFIENYHENCNFLMKTQLNFFDR